MLPVVLPLSLRIQPKTILTHPPTHHLLTFPFLSFLDLPFSIDLALRTIGAQIFSNFCTDNRAKAKMVGRPLIHHQTGIVFSYTLSLSHTITGGKPRHSDDDQHDERLIRRNQVNYTHHTLISFVHNQ